MDAWYALPILALIAGAAALVPLGHQVLRRGVVFVDLAVAQAAAAGALWGMVLVHQDHIDPWGVVDGGGLVGALLCAAAVGAISRRWPQRREALIGLLYVVFACMALLGARLDAHGRDRMLELLAADVLWAQAAPVAALVMAALGLWTIVAAKPGWLCGDAAFYGIFAVVISLAVPVLGLFVVFALLIGPALCLDSRAGEAQAFGRVQALQGVAWGSVAGLAGLAASAQWDLPSGPCVALGCALVGLAALFRRR